VYSINGLRRSLLILVLVGGLMGGCASLPDTRGFTAATIQLKEAVGTTGEAVKTEVATAKNARATTVSEDSIKKLDAAWSATMRSLEAMVAYAQSIEQIVDSGNRGAESARQVADSVKRLVETVKVDATTGASAKAVQLSTDTVAFVYGEYAKNVAAKSLEEALDKFGPSMVKISALVQAQVADARRLFVEQIRAQVDELDAGSGYGDWIKRNDDLSAKQKNATEQLLALTGPGSAGDPAKVNALKATLAQLELVRQQVAPHVEEYNQRIKAIRQREKAGLSIIGAAENALATWGATHQQLAKAVKERKSVNVDSLVAAVAEVRTLSQRWREL
jgi:hypothetical protein